MKKVNLKIYFDSPESFVLRKVSEHQDIPKGLVTKSSKWVGFDLVEEKYAKFSKTLFTKLIADKKVLNNPTAEKKERKVVEKKEKKTEKKSAPKTTNKVAKKPAPKAKKKPAAATKKKSTPKK